MLIIDNADHVTDKAITAGLDLLIRTAASRLRLVLCARADPQLEPPLGQQRERDQEQGDRHHRRSPFAR